MTQLAQLLAKADAALKKANWDEGKHPREDSSGQFTTGGGGSNTRAEDGKPETGSRRTLSTKEHNAEVQAQHKDGLLTDKERDSRLKSEDKPAAREGAGLFRTALGLVAGYYSGKTVAGIVAKTLLSGSLISPAAAVGLGVAGGIVVGGVVYSLITKNDDKFSKKQKPLVINTDAEAKAFLEKLPKYLTDEQLGQLGAKLKARAKKDGKDPG